jgi:hypothetical protein
MDNPNENNDIAFRFSIKFPFKWHIKLYKHTFFAILVYFLYVLSILRLIKYFNI